MRRRFARRRKRRTNWVMGANFGEDVDNATILLTTNGSAANTAFTVELTNAADLASSGGEGAVVVRVVGSLHFSNLGRPVTDAAGYVRVALFTMQRGQIAAALNPQAPDLFTLAGQAQENILWMDQCFVSPVTNEPAVYTGLDLGVLAGKLYVDAGARRRLEENLSLALTIQSAPAVGGAPAAAASMEVSGYLRVLLMHAL